MTNAVVVGSGPNGLAAALTLAAAGVQVQVLEAAEAIGGGTRSSELTLPGLVHDECSGFHPLALDTNFTRQFDLTAAGVEWRWPAVQYSHPLDGSDGAAVYRSPDVTAQGLGSDGPAWQRVFGSLAGRFDDISTEFTQPILHLPRHPVKLARFGAFAALPAAVLARNWRTPQAQALFSGVAAHAMRPFSSPVSSAIGVALGTAAHTYGWPVAAGGSGAISAAMVRLLEGYGGTVQTGVRVDSLEELGNPDVVMLDVAPQAAAKLAGHRLPGHVSKALGRYRYGPGAFKVDFAVEGGVPWRHHASRSAGTVHVGGSYAEVAAAERAVARGKLPDRLFVLVGQQAVADPQRGRDNIVPIYSYAHVPAGFTGDVTAAVVDRIEEFAPGFRDRILATHVRSTTQLEAHNPNYVGGDIVTGANDALQLVFRPRPSLDPYWLGARGLFICSAATPPGAGAHGMCGWNAAQSALRRLASV